MHDIFLFVLYVSPFVRQCAAETSVGRRPHHERYLENTVCAANSFIFGFALCIVVQTSVAQLSPMRDTIIHESPDNGGLDPPCRRYLMVNNESQAPINSDAATVLSQKVTAWPYTCFYTATIYQSIMLRSRTIVGPLASWVL